MGSPSAKEHRERLGSNIRRLRVQKGLSLRTLGMMVGVDYAYLSNIENGRANATVNVLFKIAQGLEVSVRDLF